ncbi:Gustatory receptor 184 [Halyomorpha halys]|nr:Gustatory receptor 184 [Halyomorpha halys]
MSLPAKSVRRQRTCLRSLRSALNMAAALGVVPYSLRGHNVVMGTWNLPYNVFCSFMLPFLGGLAIIIPNPRLTKSTFSMFIFTFQYVFHCITSFIFLFCNIAYRGEIAIATLQLLRIERMFFLLNMEPKISYGILKEAVMPIFVVCCSVVHIIVDKIFDFSSVMMFMTFQYANFRFFIMESLIIFFLNTIQHYLDALVQRSSPREAVLVRLCSIQDRLAEVADCIQKVYGFHVLSMSLSSFCFINVNMFFAARRITEHEPSVIITIFWIIIVFMMFFRISIVCEQMKEKGEEFYTALYKIVKKDKSHKLLSNDHLKAHLLKKKSFSFNLAGFFEVDMKFVAGVISATTTYTVILIQMGKDF